MAVPVIGYLAAGNPNSEARLHDAFIKGLAKIGYEDGKNTRIEYRWAENQYDRLPAMAAELVRQDVADCGNDHAGGSRRKGRDTYDSHRLHFDRGSGAGRVCCQPEPARRQHHRCDPAECGGRTETGGLASWGCAVGSHHGFSR
jgi:hypothetical protein